MNSEAATAALDLRPDGASFARGVHPKEGKALAEDARIEILPTPKEVSLPLLQHVGAPCALEGKARRAVALGEVVARSEAFVSAPVHASIAGKLGKEAMVTLANGRHVSALPLKADAEQIGRDELWARVFGPGEVSAHPEDHAPEEVVEAVREAGIVGLGGAAFPTHVKLRPPPEKRIDVLVVNGCECEPYLCADYRLMVEAPTAVVEGARLAARALGVARVVIGIEDNKPTALKAVREAAAEAGEGLDVRALRTKYPQGGEKQLVSALLGRRVPQGGLPLDVGVVVMNVGTAAQVAAAVLRQHPLTHRVVTVTGEGVATPKNLLVPIGTRFSELVAHCGGVRGGVARAVIGGPMMGFAVGDLKGVVTKGTSGVVLMNEVEAEARPVRPCVRCGRCVDVCPLNLVPARLAVAAKHRAWDLARRYAITACMECGCCASVCPSGLPLVQWIRTGKATMPRD